LKKKPNGGKGLWGGLDPLFSRKERRAWTQVEIIKAARENQYPRERKESTRQIPSPFAGKRKTARNSG